MSRVVIGSSSVLSSVKIRMSSLTLRISVSSGAAR